MKAEFKNAIIGGASIRIERGFMISIGLSLKYDGCGQGFGYGYCLYNISKPYADFAGHFLARIMQIADVKSWNDVVGKSIRVKATNEKVFAIGHIVKDDWFCPDNDIALAKDNHGK